MNKRDRAIIKSLEDFRVLDRDQLIELHFKNLKQPIVVCNRVMNRLHNRGYVRVNKMFRPYEYSSASDSLNFRSNKVLHFKAIANTVIEAKRLGTVKEYVVEIKLGKKGTVEPDLFIVWDRIPMFVEVQRSNLSFHKYMEKKLDRYEAYFESGAWKELHWQRRGKEFFPAVVIITERPYKLEERPFHVVQVASWEELKAKIKGNQ